MSRAMWHKKRRRKKIKLNPAAVVIFFAVVLAAGVLSLVLTDSFGIASSLSQTLRQAFATSSVDMVDEDGTEVIDGDYTIDSPGVRLEDVRITGDLHLDSGIGDGEVDLVNVTVEGAVLVQGGGVKSIFMLNCDFAEVKVNRPEGRVRLVASGETVIDQVSLETSARVVENLSGETDGIRSIEVKTDEKIELGGEFETIKVTVQDAKVEIDSERLEHLRVDSTASGCTFEYPDGMVIENMRLKGTAYLFGRAEVDQALISASGVSELEGNFNQLRVTSEAGKFELIEGSYFKELDVAKDALNNVFSVGEEVTIEYLILNEAVTMKGAGIIESVLVSAAGSTLEQIPAEIEFTEEVSIVTGGHEISSSEMLKALLEHGDPHYASADTTAAEIEESVSDPEPEPEPEPAEEEDLEPVEETEAEPEEEPEPEVEPESESDQGEDGNVAAGDESDEAREASPDFDLDIVIPTQDERARLSLHGKNLVYISLRTDDPGEYLVEIPGLEIRYLEDVQLFYGVVDEDKEEADLEEDVSVQLKDE